MSKLIGIIVYEIIDNGRILKGIFTNNDSRNEPTQFDITNDIARKENDGIVGNYLGSYTTAHDGAQVDYRLEILPSVVNTNSVYIFVWRDRNRDGIIYRGIGLNAGNNHIAVSYWGTNR